MMKRKLLLFFVMLMCSIGTWAGPDELKTSDIGNWFDNNNQSVPAERVIYVKVHDSNQLKNTLNELKEILTTADPNTLQHDWQKTYYNALDAATINNNQYSGMIAQKRLILKVVFEKGDGANDPETLVLTDDALAALNSIDVPTIDLQDANITNSGFSLSNPYVRNLILPDGFTKEQVTTAAQGCSNLGSAFSIASPTDGIGSGCAVNIYVNASGTLHNAIRRSGYLNNNNDKLGYVNPYTFSVNKIVEVAYTGNPSARDFAGSGGGTKFNTDGHFAFNVEADETKTEQFSGIGGVERVTVGEPLEGALTGASLVKLDLGDAIIIEANCNDLTLSRCNVLNDATKQVIFPTTSLLKTIPADCLMCSLKSLEEICIPGNIEYIKTRAFYSTDQVLKHVWTTTTKTLAEGEEDHTVYDNGTYLVSNRDEVHHYGQAPLTSDIWNCRKSVDEVGRYGTITLPANLKLIESHSFSCRGVSDVYVLAEEAPECHVDAFSTIMYFGNNTIDNNGVNGMITRWSYAQSLSKGEYISFLHYPRTVGTPNSQRYYDPTREYSVATTMRDGKGNIIYFPNQSEMNRAYLQGTTGYLWYAWDYERVPDMGNNGNANSFKNVNLEGLTMHTTEAQQLANSLYVANDMSIPGDENLDKTKRTFYDVRLDGDGQPSLTKPADLEWYYNQYRSGKQLYPQAVTEGVTDDQGYPVMETVPVYDANGEIVYDELPSGSSYEGNYTRTTVQRYVEAEDGTYCHQLNRDDNNGQWTIGYSYTANPTGGWVKASYNNQLYIQWQDYMASDPSYMNAQRYDREISGLIKFTDQWGAPRYNISEDYVEYASYDNEYKEYLTRYNLEDAYVYSPAQSGDPEPYYQMQTQDVQVQKIVKANDYRGWHQFILHAFATMSDEPFTPVKFYQTDNDWWTVCLPYDLRYKDMIKFFGNETTGAIPYLSKLRYVVRDYDKEKITLMFSKNLMEYKEVITNPSSTDDFVHGVIDDVTEYTDAEKAANPIILHKGVPYLIRPNLPANANRQFDVYKTSNDDLYERLIDSENVGAQALETYIYKGEYTVPAYVVGTTIPEQTVESRSFQHAAGPTFTYNSTDKIIYGGEEIEASISNDFSYTFVGSFFLSLMPKYCYFLGWNGRATFWYNRVGKTDSYDWNNQTGIICPNFNTSLTIDPATSLSDPARWTFGASDIECDDLIGGTQGAKTNTEAAMEEGGAIFSVDVVVNGIGKINTDDASDGIERADVIYDLHGVRMNQSLKSLPKGIYIVNGKKYVVK